MSVSFNFELSPRPNKEGLYKVVLRLTSNRKHKRIQSSVVIEKKNYNPEAKYGEWIRKSHPKYRQLNGVLLKMVDEYRTISQNMPSNSSPQNALEIIVKEKTTLKSFYEELINNAKGNYSLSRYNKLKNHYKHVRTCFDEQTPVEDLTHQHAHQFSVYLLEHLGVNNAREIFMDIRGLFNTLVAANVIVKNPFISIKLPKHQPSNKIKLKDEEIEVVKTNRHEGIESKYKHLAPELYMISYYHAGIRIGDMLQLRYENVDLENGRITYKMGKTQKLRSIPIRKEALPILEKYYIQSSKPTDYYFPCLDNRADYAHYITTEDMRKMPFEAKKKLYRKIKNCTTLINRSLQMSVSEHIDGKKITFHTSRHSFADKARRMMKLDPRITIDALRMMMAHSNFKTTQVYLDSFDLEGQDIAHEAIFGDNN